MYPERAKAKGRQLIAGKTWPEPLKSATSPVRDSETHPNPPPHPLTQRSRLDMKQTGRRACPRQWCMGDFAQQGGDANGRRRSLWTGNAGESSPAGAPLKTPLDDGCGLGMSRRSHAARTRAHILVAIWDAACIKRTPPQSSTFNRARR
uniref:Uncharacterized protein n=1 Tax=Plectus sambesii TaxID=2011161 RepID=A0A914WLX4_9BILA